MNQATRGKRKRLTIMKQITTKRILRTITTTRGGVREMNEMILIMTGKITPYTFGPSRFYYLPYFYVFSCVIS